MTKLRKLRELHKTAREKLQTAFQAYRTTPVGSVEKTKWLKALAAERNANLNTLREESESSAASGVKTAERIGKLEGELADARTELLKAQETEIAARNKVESLTADERSTVYKIDFASQEDFWTALDNDAGLLIDRADGLALKKKLSAGCGLIQPAGASTRTEITQPMEFSVWLDKAGHVLQHVVWNVQTDGGVTERTPKHLYDLAGTLSMLEAKVAMAAIGT